VTLNLNSAAGTLKDAVADLSRTAAFSLDGRFGNSGLATAKSLTLSGWVPADRLGAALRNPAVTRLEVAPWSPGSFLQFEASRRDSFGRASASGGIFRSGSAKSHGEPFRFGGLPLEKNGGLPAHSAFAGPSLDRPRRDSVEPNIPRDGRFGRGQGRSVSFFPWATRLLSWGRSGFRQRGSPKLSVFCLVPFSILADPDGVRPFCPPWRTP